MSLEHMVVMSSRSTQAAYEIQRVLMEADKVRKYGESFPNEVLRRVYRLALMSAAYETGVRIAGDYRSFVSIDSPLEPHFYQRCLIGGRKPKKGDVVQARVSGEVMSYLSLSMRALRFRIMQVIEGYGSARLLITSITEEGFEAFKDTLLESTRWFPKIDPLELSYLLNIEVAERYAVKANEFPIGVSPEEARSRLRLISGL